MIATEPLPERGLGRRSAWPAGETFTDQRHLIIYGQRTADDRLAFGGRGAPYHFGSRDPARVRPRAARSSPSCAGCWSTCSPRSRDAAVTHRWGGPLGIAARLVRLGAGSTGAPGWAGPAATSATASRTTNLAGRTLADLIAATATPT